ncbi:PfkB family carbohydrate kinase [Paeniglutamicibacter cryotolerans]|uniref:pyridoxal kinase n=1 Tax=Paeniglutamicibacter cryotolerans TaxID=670079 RepID=A0A839QN34_9MICC|nr:PfkB family carbohydrate kinase [Paeniglutamicibacter cryotolerans]MBB2997003.1 pyridoxine kinase [Paeniglutamicibacter cryotolerans]
MTRLPHEMDRRPVEAVVIGSQLAYGSVGNNAIGRLLSEAGHRCVMVPTTLLSNLPHYEGVSGGSIPDEWLSGILDDLLRLEVLDPVRVIAIGYLSSPGQAAIIARWLVRFREVNENALILVDPIMGDDDVGLYVAPEVAASFAEHLLPLANAITPNRFELGVIAGKVPEDLDEVCSQAEKLLSATTEWVVVTSAQDPREDNGIVLNVVLTDEATEVRGTEFEPSTAKGAGDLFVGHLLCGLFDDLEPLGLMAAVEASGAAVVAALSSATAHPELD